MQDNLVFDTCSIIQMQFPWAGLSGSFTLGVLTSRFLQPLEADILKNQPSRNQACWNLFCPLALHVLSPQLGCLSRRPNFQLIWLQVCPWCHDNCPELPKSDAGTPILSLRSDHPLDAIAWVEFSHSPWAWMLRFLCICSANRGSTFSKNCFLLPGYISYLPPTHPSMLHDMHKYLVCRGYLLNICWINYVYVNDGDGRIFNWYEHKCG